MYDKDLFIKSEIYKFEISSYLINFWQCIIFLWVITTLNNFGSHCVTKTKRNISARLYSYLIIPLNLSSFIIDLQNIMYTSNNSRL